MQKRSDKSIIGEIKEKRFLFFIIPIVNHDSLIRVFKVAGAVAFQSLGKKKKLFQEWSRSDRPNMFGDVRDLVSVCFSFDLRSGKWSAVTTRIQQLSCVASIHYECSGATCGMLRGYFSESRLATNALRYRVLSNGNSR
jgi:hypothetical protein